MTDSENGTSGGRTGGGGADPGALSWGKAAYDAYATGLYTYCLAVLRDHDDAAEALRSTFVLADRHIGRLPDLGLLKPWLYALARYECLVRLDAHHRASEPERPGDLRVMWAHDRASLPPPVKSGPATDARVVQLAALAWPDAVGLDPQRREALELAVRHSIDSPGVAAVMGVEEDYAKALLRDGGAEVDRTRAVVSGAQASVGCREGQALADGRLTSVGRDRLVVHTDGCPRCAPYVRLAAAALAPTTGPGAAPSALPLVTPPAGLRAEVLGDVGRGRQAPRPDDAASARRITGFDRSGFPVFRTPRTGRRRRRATFVTVAVIAAVVAAPAIALWQSARAGTPEASTRDTRISSVTVDTVAPGASVVGVGESSGEPRPQSSSASAEATAGAAPASSASGQAKAASPGATQGAVAGPVAVGAQVGPVAGAGGVPAGGPAGGGPGGGGSAPGGPGGGSGGPPPQPVAPVVDVTHTGDRTVITLRNVGQVPVDWTAATTADWLRLDRTSGTLAPGATDSVTVTVDPAKAPQGKWTAQVRIDPGGSVVTINGTTGPGGGTPPPSPSPSGSPVVSPSGTAPSKSA